LAHNPLRPAYRETMAAPVACGAEPDWRGVSGGIHMIGHHGDAFGYDNEGPRHRVWLEDFCLASRPVTNAEFLAFIEDGGYGHPGLWLSDGWSLAQANRWDAPLYWEQRDGQWWHMTLGGLRPLDLQAPVCHVSHFEAAAFALWAGKRLPTEAEWEVAAAQLPIAGNFRESGYLQPVAGSPDGGSSQMYGDVWEWTASPYTPYPGFKPPAGAVGEYNGKFMSGQMVLRGGSCATPEGHVRSSYRNFFYPKDRWQFSGIRLAGNP
jgi:ergothioneine biosynthesis protein EgtB